MEPRRMDQNMVRLTLCALLRLELRATIAEITSAAETVNCAVCRLDRLAWFGGDTLMRFLPSICEPEPRFHSPGGPHSMADLQWPGSTPPSGGHGPSRPDAGCLSSDPPDAGFTPIR